MNCSSPLQRGWTHAWVAADTEFDRAFLSDTEAAGNYPVSSGSRSSINSHRRRPVGPKSQQVSFGRDPAVNEVFCSANTRKRQTLASMPKISFSGCTKLFWCSFGGRIVY